MHTCTRTPLPVSALCFSCVLVRAQDDGGINQFCVCVCACVCVGTQNTHFLLEPEIPHVDQNPQNCLGRLSRSQQPKFGMLDASWSADAWVSAMSQFLSTYEDYKKAMLKVRTRHTHTRVLAGTYTDLHMSAARAGQACVERE